MRAYGKAIGLALLLAVFVRGVGLEAFKIPSASMLPTLQLVPLLDTQTVAVWPSLIASDRANCISPSSPLTSAAMRLELVTYLYEGIAIVIRIATMAITDTISSSVMPRVVRR